MNFQSNPKPKPGKNRPASSPRLIQGPQLPDFTKESLKVSPGREYVDLGAGLLGLSHLNGDLLWKTQCT
jgi:hypothetical protein